MTMDRTAFPGEVIPVKLPLGNDITDWLDYRLLHTLLRRSED